MPSSRPVARTEPSGEKATALTRPGGSNRARSVPVATSRKVTRDGRQTVPPRSRSGSAATASTAASARPSGERTPATQSSHLGTDASSIDFRFAEGLSPDLESALSRLTPGEREVVALRVLLELDAGTAARVLGISPTNCTTRLNRALKKLEEALHVAA